MLYNLESNLSQCTFSVSKWPFQAVVRMYTEQTSLVVEVAQLKHTCDKFQNGITEVFLSFPGGF